MSTLLEKNFSILLPRLLMRHRPVLCAVFGGSDAVQAAESFQEAAVIREAALGAGVQDGNALLQRLAAIPMFVREGAVIAMADNQLMTMEGDHTTALHLIVAPKGTTTTTLYDDDGITNDFKSGVYRKTTITTTAGERVTMNFASEGSYKDTVETIKVEMIAKEKSPFWVTLDGRKIEHFLNRRKFDAAAEGWYYSQSKKAVEVKYANPAKDHELTVSFEQFDLIGM